MKSKLAYRYYKKIIVAFIFQFFFMATTFSIEKYFTVDYNIQRGDTFAIILSRFLKNNSIVRKENPMVIKIRKENPQIVDWNRIDKKIKLFLSPQMVDEKKLTKKVLMKWKERQELIQNQFKFSLLYMLSLGSYTQDFESQLQFIYNQVSLFTIGGFFDYSPQGKKYSFSTDIRISSFITGKEPILNLDYTPPIQLDLNSYLKYQLKWRQMIFYSGIEFENFGTINQDKLLNNNKLENISNNIFYLSIGIAKEFQIKLRHFDFKFILSKSIFSLKNSLSKNYSGYKLSLNFNYNINKTIKLYTLFKYNNLMEEYKLSLLKYSYGVVYMF